MSDFEILSLVLVIIGIIVKILVAWIQDMNSRKK